MTFPDQQQRPIFLSGKVMMDDGTPPPDQVTIERVCGGIIRPEGYADSKGRFSFQLGQNTAMMPDASVGSDAGGFGGGGFGQPRQTGGTMGGRGAGVNERDLMGCEIRASLAGFRSDVVSLAGRRMLDNPDVGTIVLHRLAKVDGFTFSGTSAFAPKDAKKAYEKGREQAKKKKWEDAEKELQKAVTAYPKYAAAWYELGMVQQQQNRAEDARKSFSESINADAKFVSPYAQLARMAVAENKWPDVAENTGRLIKLNPYYSPEVYLYSAIANLQMQKLDVAEEHAREALKMDEKHRMPKANHVLGVILAQKQDFPAAAENLRDYLKFAPNAQDGDQVRKQLAQVEQLMGAKNPAQQTQTAQ
jgi:Flp pilus assembly protein TadD